MFDWTYSGWLSQNTKNHNTYLIKLTLFYWDATTPNNMCVYCAKFMLWLATTTRKRRPTNETKKTVCMFIFNGLKSVHRCRAYRHSRFACVLCCYCNRVCASQKKIIWKRKSKQSYAYTQHIYRERDTQSLLALCPCTFPTCTPELVYRIHVRICYVASFRFHPTNTIHKYIHIVHTRTLWCQPLETNSHSNYFSRRPFYPSTLLHCSPTVCTHIHAHRHTNSLLLLTYRNSYTHSHTFKHNTQSKYDQLLYFPTAQKNTEPRNFKIITTKKRAKTLCACEISKKTDGTTSSEKCKRCKLKRGSNNNYWQNVCSIALAPMWDWLRSK